MLHRARILAWLAWDASSFFEWLAKRPWYTQILIEWVTAIPVAPGDSALELGCGPGIFTGHLYEQGVQIIGLDQSAAMVERARKNVPDCEFIEGDAMAIPLDDDSVDVAFAASVVNVVSTPEKLVREMVRVVRSSGRVSVLFPTPRLSSKAAMIAKRRKIAGLSAAALASWGRKAPKCEAAVIEALFDNAGLLDIRTNRLFDDAVASVTGRVP
jgi:ubiquinone/menaquinone biosynthesis C-methylase UbiE